MRCPGCRRETALCVVCAAGSDCPTPVCVECAQKELGQAAHLQKSQNNPKSGVLHRTRVVQPAGPHEGDKDLFDVECDCCGIVGSAGTETEAKAIARLHEAFVATLMERWSVEGVAAPGRSLRAATSAELGPVSVPGDDGAVSCTLPGEGRVSPGHEVVTGSADLDPKAPDVAGPAFLVEAKVHELQLISEVVSLAEVGEQSGAIVSEYAFTFRCDPEEGKVRLGRDKSIQPPEFSLVVCVDEVVNKLAGVSARAPLRALPGETIRRPGHGYQQQENQRQA